MNNRAKLRELFGLQKDKDLREGEHKIISKALFGGKLAGDNAVRFVYIDEAGTSAQEPVTVVVGIVVHADKQWALAASAIADVLKAVPDCYQAGFIFHAKAIWGDKKYHANWSKSERLNLLHTMMSMPPLLKIPIALGIVRRNSPAPASGDLPPSLSMSELQHSLAFWMCVTQADKFLRKHAGPNEVATVVAEDVPKIRKWLRHALNIPEVTLSREQL
jgi:hypothetical protein